MSRRTFACPSSLWQIIFAGLCRDDKCRWEPSIRLSAAEFRRRWLPSSCGWRWHVASRPRFAIMVAGAPLGRRASGRLRDEGGLRYAQREADRTMRSTAILENMEEDGLLSGVRSARNAITITVTRT